MPKARPETRRVSDRYLSRSTICNVLSNTVLPAASGQEQSCICTSLQQLLSTLFIRKTCGMPAAAPATKVCPVRVAVPLARQYAELQLPCGQGALHGSGLELHQH